MDETGQERSATNQGELDSVMMAVMSRLGLTTATMKAKTAVSSVGTT